MPTALPGTSPGLQNLLVQVPMAWLWLIYRPGTWPLRQELCDILSPCPSVVDLGPSSPWSCSQDTPPPQQAEPCGRQPGAPRPKPHLHPTQPTIMPKQSPEPWKPPHPGPKAQPVSTGAWRGHTPSEASLGLGLPRGEARSEGDRGH